jgi:dipeptidyl aminopeptidase/acylaminoacyl peptidase
MNYRKNLFMTVLIAVMITFCSAQLLLSTEDQDAQNDVKAQDITQWLLLGPVSIPAVEKELIKDDGGLVKLNHLAINNLLPRAGENVRWNGTGALKWKSVKEANISFKEKSIAYMATYLEPSRWLQTQLVLDKTDLKIAVYLNGKSIALRPEGDKTVADLTLANEKHVLIIKALAPKQVRLTMKGALKNKKAFAGDKIRISLVPQRRMRPENVLNMYGVSGIAVSPDGKYAKLNVSKRKKESGKSERWVEILDTASGAVVFSSSSIGSISGFQWMGNSDTFSYTVSNKEKSSIFKYQLSTHKRTPILENIDKFSNYSWSNDYSFLVYSTYRKEKGGDGYSYIKEIPDRAGEGEYKNTTYIYFPYGGSCHRISSEKQNFQVALISRDNKKILIFKSEPNNKYRPYFMNSFYLFDVASMTMEEKPLLESTWINNFDWSPDSKKLVLMGGPSAFNGLGKNLKNDVIPNDYDVQAYLFDMKSRKAEAISKTFDPTINNVYWTSPGTMYITAGDKADVGIFKYNVKKKTYTRLNTLVDVVSGFGIAENGSVALYWGSSSNVPDKLYRLDLKSGKASILKDYNREYFKDVSIGDVKEWNYKTPEGKVITGRIHLPVNFDETKKYPCIVYYYGGTSPVTRNFGGRYPKNWYTANGYIVYVLQPSGSTGFGQDFSAVHVNDWGIVTSQEIIGAVKQLVKEHSYIDGKRLGAMGASYGGFMTMYLATHTDLFAAYISHAGISALSSYWGIGDYGYTYSGVATAESFPWNRKDLYVENSPLFHADKVNSPILLLHGDIDNNVPPGESYQMFAALKLLGKDVELVTFKGQRHWILEYNKRLRWMRTIIAWWDKHLKKQPEHWKYMYKK